jgi:putative ubiquitin-RnfH superfamily antitoxin RatB of RatAB toxin-antitoxin module
MPEKSGPEKPRPETGSIEIEVACAWPEKQIIRSLRVPVGTTARQALRRSGLTDELKARDINIKTVVLGVFGRVVPDSYVPLAGERIEVYRPLRLDPREARKKRSKSVQPVRRAESR